MRIRCEPVVTVKLVGQSVVQAYVAGAFTYVFGYEETEKKMGYDVKLRKDSVQDEHTRGVERQEQQTVRYQPFV